MADILFLKDFIILIMVDFLLNIFAGIKYITKTLENFVIE